MTVRRCVVLAVMIVCLGAATLAQDEILPLSNWGAAPYWIAAVQPRAEGGSGTAMVAQAQRMYTQAENLPSSPLPFVAITPCRIVDTRVNVADGFHEPNFADDETRTFDLPNSPDCTGLPSTAGAWSLNVQFRPIAQASYITMFPTGTTRPGVSTTVATPAGFTTDAAIVPAGTNGDIDVYCQYAGRVVIDINGYYASQSLVSSLNTKTGNLTLAAGSNVTITPSANTLTIDGPASLPPIGAAGGGLSGDYPDPGIAPGAVGSSQLADSTAVRSINATAQDGVTIQGSGGITVGTAGSTVTIGIPAGTLATPDLARVALLNWWGGPYSGGSYGFDYPYGVAFDGTHIWVTNLNGDSVTELNASDGSWVRTLSSTGGLATPRGVAFDGSHIWVANNAGNSVTELNASDGSWVQSLSGGSYGFSGAEGLAFDGTHIWVTNASGNSVTEIDASNGNWVRTLSGGSYGFNSPRGLAFDGTHIWVTNPNGDSVTELDASDGSWVRTLSGGSYGFNGPLGVAFDGTHIWVTNANGDSVTVLYASNGEWVQTLSGGSYGFSAPWGLAFDGMHIWVTNRNGASVTELNGSDGSWVQTLSGDPYDLHLPCGVAFDGVHIWIANYLGNSVTAIPAR